MPNWCTNHMVVQGDAALVAELAAKVVKPDPDKANEMTSDFEGIFPMPESLQVVEGSESSIALEFYRLDDQLPLTELDSKLYDWLVTLLKQNTSELLDWQCSTVATLKALLESDAELAKRCRLDFVLGQQLLTNIERYGYPTWYWWRVEN